MSNRSLLQLAIDFCIARRQAFPQTATCAKICAPNKAAAGTSKPVLGYDRFQTIGFECHARLGPGGTVCNFRSRPKLLYLSYNDEL